MHRFPAICLAILLFLSACLPAHAAQPIPTPLENYPTQTSAPQTKKPIIEKEGPNPQWVALIQLDGNIHMVNNSTGWSTQATEDGTGLPQAGTSSAGQVTFYCCMSWSSDGQLLAFRSSSWVNSGEPGYRFAIGVYDMASEKAHMLLQNENPIWLAFRPGTHLLAYDEAVSGEYFASGQPDASKARGIMGLNVDTGEITELVKPERGLWLTTPRWSPDGNMLGFLEQKQYEAAGNFALYDFQAQAYHAWDREVGAYTFAPDGQHIVYDRLITGARPENNRIWVSDSIGQGEHPISPEGAPSASAPVWSPQGDLIAYLAGDQAGNGPDTPKDLMVLAVSGGDPRKLGSFTNIGPLAWSPDEKKLAFSTGKPDQPKVLIVTVADGSVKELGMGIEPVWEP